MLRLKRELSSFKLIFMHVHASHGSGGSTGRVLKISLALTAGYIVVLVVAGIRAHSLALLSEAGHNLSDFLALLLSLGAVYLQARPPSATKTYGYHRAGVLAAMVNRCLARGRVVLHFLRSVQTSADSGARARRNHDVGGGGRRCDERCDRVAAVSAGKDVNIRSALLHEVGDTVSTAAVIVGGWAILATGQDWIDSALSFGIGALILWSAFRDRPRDAEHSARRHAARDEGRRIEACDAARLRASMTCTICMCGASDPRATRCRPRNDRRYSDVGERQDSARGEREAGMMSFGFVHTTIQFEHEDCEMAHGCVDACRGWA